MSPGDPPAQQSQLPQSEPSAPAQPMGPEGGYVCPSSPWTLGPGLGKVPVNLLSQSPWLVVWGLWMNVKKTRQEHSSL